MISLSNLIKSSHYVPLKDKKRVEIIRSPITPYPSVEELVPTAEGGAEEEARLKQLEAGQREAERMILEAEVRAKELVDEAAAEAERLKDETKAEIEQWWQERRKQDEDLREQGHKEGFEQGYQEGWRQAETELKEKYSSDLEQAQSILIAAHEQKKQIIHQAEPFLIELSTAIAEKVIRKQLSVSNEWVVELVASTLAMKRDKGLITLCVSPEHYPLIKEAAVELEKGIDPEAELLIVADSNVKDDGCVIRSALGSMDARIDTQLSEIRQVLMQMAAGEVDSNGTE